MTNQLIQRVTHTSTHVEGTLSQADICQVKTTAQTYKVHFYIEYTLEIHIYTHPMQCWMLTQPLNCSLLFFQMAADLHPSNTAPLPLPTKLFFGLKKSPADFFCKNSVISRMQSGIGVIFFLPISVKQHCLLISAGLKETPLSKHMKFEMLVWLQQLSELLSWTPSWLS